MEQHNPKTCHKHIYYSVYSQSGIWALGNPWTKSSWASSQRVKTLLKAGEAMAKSTIKKAALRWLTMVTVCKFLVVAEQSWWVRKIFIYHTNLLSFGKNPKYLPIIKFKIFLKIRKALQMWLIMILIKMPMGFNLTLSEFLHKKKKKKKTLLNLCIKIFITLRLTTQHLRKTKMMAGTCHHPVIWLKLDLLNPRPVNTWEVDCRYLHLYLFNMFVHFVTIKIAPNYVGLHVDFMYGI